MTFREIFTEIMRGRKEIINKNWGWAVLYPGSLLLAGAVVWALSLVGLRLLPNTGGMLVVIVTVIVAMGGLISCVAASVGFVLLMVRCCWVDPPRDEGW